jgi:HAD superfamily hydrolase (TIGR01509 family)
MTRQATTKTPRIRAMLVDFDGTLAGTAIPNAQAYQRALAESGHVASLPEIEEAASGRHWRDFLGRWIPDADAAESVAVRKRELYTALVVQADLNRPLVALIRKHQRGRATALVTTAAAPSTRLYLKTHALEDLFDLVITGEDVVRHKPDPEAYELAAKRLGVEPRHCLAFEDSPAGLTAARSFGARVRQVRFHP